MTVTLEKCTHYLRPLHQPPACRLGGGGAAGVLSGLNRRSDFRLGEGGALDSRNNWLKLKYVHPVKGWGRQKQGGLRLSLGASGCLWRKR